MSIPLPVVLEGIITGLGYGLLAMGLVLVYRTNRVLNFAQGQLGVVAAVFMVKLYYDFGINYWAALVDLTPSSPPRQVRDRSFCCADSSTARG